jgi:hypothetical protein
MSKEKYEPTEEEKAKIQESRTLSDADLIKEGAKFVPNLDGEPRLDVTKEQVNYAEGMMEEEIYPEATKQKKEAIKKKNLEFLSKLKKAEAIMNRDGQFSTFFEENMDALAVKGIILKIDIDDLWKRGMFEPDRFQPHIKRKLIGRLRIRILRPENMKPVRDDTYVKEHGMSYFLEEYRGSETSLDIGFPDDNIYKTEEDANIFFSTLKSDLLS